MAPLFTVDQRAERVIKYNRPTGTVFSGPERGGGRARREWKKMRSGERREMYREKD